MPRLRKVEIAKIMDEEPRACATCATILAEDDETYCPTCASYWRDVDNGLFEDNHDWPDRGQKGDIDC